MSTDSPETPSIEFLLDVPIQLNAELGTCAMTCRDLLKLDIGSVVQLDKPAHASVNLYVNTKLVA
ncbi:MAG: FliM/FliN family flagellar motor switch protein, partial [Verrucomicrobiota bacterium]